MPLQIKTRIVNNHLLKDLLITTLGRQVEKCGLCSNGFWSLTGFCLVAPNLSHSSIFQHISARAFLGFFCVWRHLSGNFFLVLFKWIETRSFSNSVCLGREFSHQTNFTFYIWYNIFQHYWTRYNCLAVLLALEASSLAGSFTVLPFLFMWAAQKCSLPKMNFLDI